MRSPSGLRTTTLLRAVPFVFWLGACAGGNEPNVTDAGASSVGASQPPPASAPSQTINPSPGTGASAPSVAPSTPSPVGNGDPLDPGAADTAPAVEPTQSPTADDGITSPSDSLTPADGGPATAASSMEPNSSDPATLNDEPQEAGASGIEPVGGVSVVGREVYVNGAPFHIRGVNWNPVPKGAVHPEGLDYAGFADRDIALMQAAGINAVRTYERLEDHAVLDKLYAAGIYVFSTVYGWWQDDASVVTQRVDAAKEHPAIVAWVIGNEWNYNQLYSDGQLSLEQTRDRLKEVAALIKAADPTRPVSTIWGGTAGLGEMVDAMPEIDVWGINAYQGRDNASVFDAWQSISEKPMYLGEYGVDAWDSRGEGHENLAAHEEAVGALTQQLIDNYTDGSSGVALGGFIFEWSDEWWKDAAGSPAVQDKAGIVPEGSGGPYPDGVFNEEYWGLVDIDRNPRPAYNALAELYLPLADPAQ